MTQADVGAIASRLIAAYDAARTLPPITAENPGFDVATAYAVLAEIERRRRAQGWRPVGRKIGFTNRTIWDRYGVHQPMWAHVFANTVHIAPNAEGSLPLAGLVQPRIEPEVVFKLKSSPPDTTDPLDLLRAVEWIAPGFEIVQSHFPDWKFTAADCTAAFGLHGALLVGPPLPVDDANRRVIAAALPAFTLQLRRGDTPIDTGVGSNVLGSPALALAHLVRVLKGQPDAPPLAAGEIVTTGTVTDAWPVAPGQTWTSDYGLLGLYGLTLTFDK
jgi:2-oxo-3-hexenedioate decarboxylase